MKLSVIIITKNEEQMITDCLKSVSNLADEIIIIDDNSKDRTIEICKRYTDKIYLHKQLNFSDQRNFGLTKVEGDWILYIDADERVSPELKEEILKTISTDHLYSAYFITRENYYLEKKWPYREKIQRLFKKVKLKSWYGDLHETPIIEGEYGFLQGRLLHYTHRDISSMLQKTITWSKVEAKLRFDAHHPKVTWWRLLRVMITQFWHYYIREGGWKVGAVGIIESMYQSFSIFITYARLYEMQLHNESHTVIPASEPESR